MINWQVTECLLRAGTFDIKILGVSSDCRMGFRKIADDGTLDFWGFKVGSFFAGIQRGVNRAMGSLTLIAGEYSRAPSHLFGQGSIPSRLLQSTYLLQG